MSKKYEVYQLSIGLVLIAEKDGFITEVEPFKEEKPFDGVREETALTKEAFRQLDEYLAAKRKEFDLKLNPVGTEFQKKVWNALLEIPYGETCSYKDIAIAIDNPKASRAVGLANNRNPISFIIPCHRVIGANGSLVGYGGGLELKKKLLKLEGSL